MSCGNTVKLTCGGKQYAVCVKYDKTLPDFSLLDECADLQETTSELYDLAGEIRDGLNFETLAGSCIEYPTGTLTTIQVLTAMQDFICAQNETIITMLENISTLQTQVADLQANNCPE